MAVKSYILLAPQDKHQIELIMDRRVPYLTRYNLKS
jgi:hypothetical protein